MALFSDVFLHVPINLINKRQTSLSNLLPIEGTECQLCEIITISKLASQKPEFWSSHWLTPNQSSGLLRQLRRNADNISPLLDRYKYKYTYKYKDSQESQPINHEFKMKCIYLGFRIYHVIYLSFSLCKYTKPIYPYQSYLDKNVVNRHYIMKNCNIFSHFATFAYHFQYYQVWKYINSDTNRMCTMSPYKTIRISKLATQKPELWSSHGLPPHPSACSLHQWRHDAESISPLLDSQESQLRKNDPKRSTYAKAEEYIMLLIPM